MSWRCVQCRAGTGHELPTATAQDYCYISPAGAGAGLGWGWRGSGGEITSDQPPAARSTVSIASLDTHPASSVLLGLG